MGGGISGGEGEIRTHISTAQHNSDSIKRTGREKRSD